MSNRILTILLVVVAAILLLPKLGLGFGIAPASVAAPPPPSPPQSSGAKFRNTIGEISSGVATLVEAGKNIAGLFGSSKKPSDYGSISI